MPFSVLVVLLLGLMALPTESGAAGNGGSHWTFLGEKHVSDRLDRDVLRLESRRGTFDSIRLRVRGHAVQFRSVEIHFENGTSRTSRCAR